MMTKQEALSSRLEVFNEQPGVKGCAIITRDGLPLVAALPRGINKETFAAMVATTVGAAETAAAEMDPSSAKSMLVEFSRTLIMTSDGGPELIVVAVADPGANTKTLASALDRLSDEVRDII